MLGYDEVIPLRGRGKMTEQNPYPHPLKHPSRLCCEQLRVERGSIVFKVSNCSISWRGDRLSVPNRKKKKMTEQSECYPPEVLSWTGKRMWAYVDERSGLTR